MEKARISAEQYARENEKSKIKKKNYLEETRFWWRAWKDINRYRNWQRNFERTDIAVIMAFEVKSEETIKWWEIWGRTEEYYLIFISGVKKKLALLSWPQEICLLSILYTWGSDSSHVKLGP